MSAAEWRGNEKLRRLIVPLTGLKLDPKNARKHSERNLRAIRSSFERSGQQTPIVISKRSGVVVRGNGTVEALRMAPAWSHVAVVEAEFKNAAAERAYALADNRSAELAEWDFSFLTLDLKFLQSKEISIEELGWDARELDKVFARASSAEEGDDDLPEDGPAVTKPGDLWLLGRHRLLCGDATKAGHVDRLLGGARPTLLVTDPPYGVEYDPAWRSRMAKKGRLNVTKQKPKKGIRNDDRVDWREAFAHIPCTVAYVWSAMGNLQIASQEALVASGFDVRAQVVWVKTHFPIGRGNYTVQHEPCWYAVRKGAPAHWIGETNESTVWHAAFEHSNEHPTKKPVELMHHAIRNHAGEVLDLFAGCGPTLIAAEKLERRSFMLEIEPKWCDVLVRRFQNFTGVAAEREDGEKFDQLAAA